MPGKTARSVPSPLRGYRYTHLILILLFCLGCAATPQPRFYHLGIHDPGSMDEDIRQKVAVLETTALPRHLDRPQIVVRRETHELVVHEDHRWAAPLDRLFRESLASRLDGIFKTTRVVPSDTISAYPTPTHRIRVRILDFSSNTDGIIRLAGFFSVQEAREGTTEKPFDLHTRAEGKSFSDFVAAQALALNMLADIIAAEAAGF
ncbi:PqiC family protein [Desulfobotulus sp. H1]|uniref:PqiC family protein n=1 Tax=Desulfobotulus pelophilus TaxID=2823377 RepID=A0ABT3NB31_9BACT|nr:PqiC family protein [Desulfobotulus pelophilus]MCW7754672.1 PqiC family protein [Desulfobotulus pelophilus]